MSGDSNIRVVCFDLGGVLIRICRSWAEGCEAAGLPVRPGLVECLEERNEWLDINRRYQINAISLHAYTQEISSLIDGLYSPAEIEQIHLAWTRDPYEGVNAIIDELHDAGVTTAALSNTNAAHWSIIGDCDPVARLHYACASHLLELHKPDPAIYGAFEDIVGEVGASILFFEDTPINADAAQAFGWQARVVDPLRPTSPQIRAALHEHGVAGSWT